MDYAKFRLRSFTTLEPIYILTCGSYSELPMKYVVANITDTDMLYCCRDICAIPCNRNPPKNTKCTVLRIDSKQTPPGFAKLEIDRNSTGYNPTYFRRPPLLNEIKTGGPSRSREKRLTREGRTSLEFIKMAIEEDMVLSIYCPYWPVEAEEWGVRKRFNGWPNEKLVARITRGGCHFVSKLRTWSSSDDTEWRFSFSKAELLLIHSWTPDQKFAYHVIRVVKRRLSEYCGGSENKGFQSYFFKTLMLWACEEFPPEFWHKYSADVYVEILFRRFLRCLDEKFCPNYFIPECNIMSHLKNEGSFDKESKIVKIFLTIKLCIPDVKYGTYQELVSVFPKPFEYLCLTKMSHLLTLNQKLNGRLAKYFSDCEWFLPEMKTLHAAIEAHLRLMSVDSVTQRQTSKDYVVCVKNFDLALLNNEEFETCVRFNTDMSVSENLIRTFARKLLKNSVIVYRRISHRDEAAYKMIKESNISALHGVTSAYRANFYFTAIQSYKESLTECEKCFELLHNIADVGIVHQIPSQHGSYIPLVLCNSLSQIFDENMQVILGFATLHRNIYFSNSRKIIATSHEVCLKLHAWEFLKYLYIQCQQKLYSISELTDYSFALNLDLDRAEMLSQVISFSSFSATILFAGLRQSKAYKNSLRGAIIPDHFRPKNIKLSS